MQVLDCVKSKGIEVKFHGRAKNEASHYCGVCEVIINLPKITKLQLAIAIIKKIAEN